MDRNEAHRKVADRLALYGTYINVGEKVDDPEWYAGEVEPFTKFDEPKAQALKPLEEAAEVFGAWQASGIDGARSITPEMREDIVYECLDTIQSCVNLLESIGTTDAELRDAARKVHANNIDRGRYEPY